MNMCIYSHSKIRERRQFTQILGYSRGPFSIINYMIYGSLVSFMYFRPCGSSAIMCTQDLKSSIFVCTYVYEILCIVMLLTFLLSHIMQVLKKRSVRSSVLIHCPMINYTCTGKLYTMVSVLYM